MKVSVFGLGYVGCVSAASFAADGHTVVGVDANPDKAASLNDGRSPIVEKGLDELIRDHSVTDALRATISTDRGCGGDRPVADLRRHAEPQERQSGSHATSSGSANRSARRSRTRTAITWSSFAAPCCRDDPRYRHPCAGASVRQDITARASASRSTPSSFAKAPRSRISGIRR